MQRLIAIVTIFVCIYAIVCTKNSGYGFTASLRVFAKHLALFTMFLLWVTILVTALMITCYSEIGGMLSNSLSANSVVGIKHFVRLVFGADSAFVALHMLALYSIFAGFVSCLILCIGVVVRVAYRRILNNAKAPCVKDRQCFEDFDRQLPPAFKVYSKYNS